MSNGEQGQKIDFTVDKNNLYREESITDIKVASIRRLIPIDASGKDDSSRNPIFMAQTQLMSPEGPVPLQSALKAGSIEEAIDEFPGAMQIALDEMVERLKKVREEQCAKKMKPQISLCLEDKTDTWAWPHDRISLAFLHSDILCLMDFDDSLWG